MKILFHLVTILLAIQFVSSRCARKYFTETEPTAEKTEAQIFIESVDARGEIQKRSQIYSL